jgi:hypothetical protein
MSKESLKTLYNHRVKLGKDVSDILKRHPEFALEEPKKKKGKKK